MPRTYRPDIDGLRAVAVLLVVARHLRITRLSGGYIGVDVFFVISGYLISSIILPEIASGTFSLATFYERRIRRIFPALIVMLAVTTAVAWRILFPTEMAAYAHSLSGAVFGYANLVFWSWAGYFDGPNELKPLLHTWSLGVEEQFYLAFPLLLLATRRLPTAWLKRLLWGATVISLAAAIAMTRHLPADGFFLSPLRAWEMLFGILIASGATPPIRSAAARNTAALTGLALILTPALLYDAHTIFPGLAAIPPCLGAALLIAADDSLVNNLLSLRPIAFVGLISYSLYLWHWPVQVFWDYTHLLQGRRENDWRAIAIVFAASLLLATASWALIERPIRTGALRPTRRTLFTTAGALAASAFLAALWLIHTAGAPTRFTPQVVRAASFLDYDNHTEDRWGACAFGPWLTKVQDVAANEACLPYRPGARHFLLIGDSHAAQLWPGLAAVFPELDIAQVNASECPMLVNLANAPKTCADVSRFLYAQYLPTHPMEAILVSYRWLDQNLDEIDALAAYAKAHNTRLIVFGPTVEYTLPLPRLLAMSMRDGNGPAEVDAHEQRRPRELDARMATLARDRWHVPYISFFQEMCLNTECPAQLEDGTPMIFDANHLTAASAIQWMQTIKQRGQL